MMWEWGDAEFNAQKKMGVVHFPEGHPPNTNPTQQL